MRATQVWLSRLAIVVLVIAPAFVLDVVWQGLLVRVSYYALLALSWNLLAGLGGQLSFAHVALATIGAYTSALLSTNGVPIPGAILAGGGVAGALGLALGFMSLRVQGIYLALTTFAFGQVAQVALTAAHDITGGASGLQTPFLYPGTTTVWLYYLTGAAMIALFLLLQRAFLRSPWRLFLVAIRDDEDAAAGIGVSPGRWKVAAFVYTGLWAGVAGAFFGHFVGIVTPVSADFTEMSLVIAVAVIGGLGSAFGSLASALVILVIGDQLRAYAAELSALLFGVAVLAIIRFFPNGMSAIPQLAWGWFKRTRIGRNAGNVAGS